jgi:hypothetical protein
MCAGVALGEVESCCSGLLSTEVAVAMHVLLMLVISPASFLVLYSSGCTRLSINGS